MKESHNSSAAYAAKSPEMEKFKILTGLERNVLGYESEYWNRLIRSSRNLSVGLTQDELEEKVA